MRSEACVRHDHDVRHQPCVRIYPVASSYPCSRLLVAAQVYYARRVRPGVRDRLDLRHQVIGRSAISEISRHWMNSPAVRLTDSVQRRACPGSRLLAWVCGRSSGTLDRQQRRRHHEDDQQHQHHVDHRRDVDLRHHGGATPAAASTATADEPAMFIAMIWCSRCAHHMPLLTPARRSGATGSLKIRRRSLPAAGPADSPRK